VGTSIIGERLAVSGQEATLAIKKVSRGLRAASWRWSQAFRKGDDSNRFGKNILTA
jgi:hypothetical protein